MKTTEIKEQVVSGKYDALIEDLYADPSLLDYQKQRYAAALDKYQTLFGDDEVSIIVLLEEVRFQEIIQTTNTVVYLQDLSI